MTRTSYTSQLILGLSALVLAFGLAGPAQATPIPVATYLFDNSLAAEQAGKANMTEFDPLNNNKFVSETVFGQTRQVFEWDGDPGDANKQAGLQLDTTNIVSNNQYSVEMVFLFSQETMQFRRIFDVSDRTEDDGFYVNGVSGNVLDLFGGGGAGSTAFTTGDFHHVVLTNSGTEVKAYLDGALEFTTTPTTNVMNITSANLMNFFIDDGGESSDGQVALINLYTGVLTEADVGLLADDPFAVIPEPTTILLLGSGLAGLVAWRMRKGRA